METEKSGVWTLPNGERVTVTLKVLPDGKGRFGGVYVTAEASLASGRPSSAPVMVTVEDDEGNSYTYTPVVPNMGLCAKLPDRFFDADYPVGNDPLPSRLIWRVTGAQLYSDDWEEASGEPFELAYYPAGRVGASGECLTRYPWRWWWGEDCEAPLPMADGGSVIPLRGGTMPFVLRECQLAIISDNYPFLTSVIPAPLQTADLRSLTLYEAGGGLNYTIWSVTFVKGNSVNIDLNAWDCEQLPATLEFSLGLMTPAAPDISVKLEKPTEDGCVRYDDFQLVTQDTYPLGFNYLAREGGPAQVLRWLAIRLSGCDLNEGCSVRSSARLMLTLEGLSPTRFEPYPVYFVCATGIAAPKLNPITNNYAPFAITGSGRDVLLAAPGRRGRLTNMRLPDCAIDYYVKWWDNGGACYVLPYSIIGGKTEGRQDGTPLYADTQTLRLASPLLTEAERKDAMTIAESPRVAIRPYGGEWSFARLKDYTVSWEAGEEDEATLEIEIIANYGES